MAFAAAGCVAFAMAGMMVLYVVMNWHDDGEVLHFFMALTAIASAVLIGCALMYMGKQEVIRAEPEEQSIADTESMSAEPENLWFSRTPCL